ncbi:hypothetical protein ACFLYO_00660, partial [Chloroflexota bacterium]
TVLGVLILFVLCIGLGPITAAPARQERVPLHYGDTVLGTISDLQNFQQYRFTGQAGDRVIITMDTIAGDLDPLLLLGDAELNLIAEDDDSGDGFGARLVAMLPIDGDYVIEATRYGQDTDSGQSTGEYQLTLQVDQAGGGLGNAPLGVMSHLNFGDTTRGLLSPQNRFQLFGFQGQVGDQVTIRSAAATDVAATLILYDAQFTELQRDPTGQQIEAVLDTAGIYFAALALADETPVDESPGGTYALTLSGVVNNLDNPDLPPLPLVYGDRIESTITADRPLEQYSFTGQMNDQVVIMMDAAGDDLDPFLVLYGPAGEIIGQDDDSGNRNNAQLNAVLPLDGQYTIAASRFGRENGTTAGIYTLELSSSALVQEQLLQSPEPSAALPAEFAGLPRLHYGDAVGAMLDDVNSYRAYVFEAAGGDEIILTMENYGGDLDPMILLLDAGLDTIAQHDDIVEGENRNSRLEFTIPADGYYAVLATRFEGEDGSTTGDYRLTFTSPNASMPSQTSDLLTADMLLSDNPVQGQLTDVMGVFYTFYAAAEDVVSLEFNAAGSLQEDVLLVLLDAALNELAVSQGSELPYEVLEDGLYVALVTRQGGPVGTAKGFYELTLYGADSAVAERLGVELVDVIEPGSSLPYGTVVEGQITDAQPTIPYYFTGQTGDRITVRLDALEATLDPLVILLDPDGNELVRDDDSGGDLNAQIVSYVLTLDGEYTLLATRPGAERGTARGAYELTLTGIPVVQPVSSATGTQSGAALPLAIGQTVNGTISNDEAAQFYGFDGVAGQTVQVEMMRLSEDLDTFVGILDTAQALVASDDDGGEGQDSRLVYTLEADGGYTIVATRFEFAEGDTTGDYLLSLLLR